ncbi:hypothetical protein QA635_06210 [Bradyrhizobium brasilense]|uniref:hypothetical protein n=1 Tax=Bradyrhizobium brasilense TaxID=1419277 RepID=UPI0024B13893|nr:hypothetical protein [Bradyrhizobium australafricanum]WFU34028.1 hypothetical protein QA635_06210 [Bradyrhizobium australafricanum]
MTTSGTTSASQEAWSQIPSPSSAETSPNAITAKINTGARKICAIERRAADIRIAPQHARVCGDKIRETFDFWRMPSTTRALQAGINPVWIGKNVGNECVVVELRH